MSSALDFVLNAKLRVGRAIRQRLEHSPLGSAFLDGFTRCLHKVFSLDDIHRRQKAQRLRFDRSHPLGINIAAPLTGEFGLGEAARGLVHALEIAKMPYALNDFPLENQRKLDNSIQNFSANNPYPVNLLAIGDASAYHFYFLMGAPYFKGKYNIGLLYWELSQYPESRWPNLDFYNEIWVTSSFCAEALGKAARVPVVKITHSLFIEETQVQENRSRFGLPEDAFIFVAYFDFQSFFERKNPLSVINAFRKAFPGREDVILIIKSINAHSCPDKLQMLTEAADGLNVRFLHEHFNRYEMLSLFKSSDCLVSLHRSEGLGLGMAEAMYLGKPVVATAYSGNLDFMNVNNSLLVKYRLVELEEDYGPYPKGNVWAEPDCEHAAELMMSVYQDGALAAQLGCRASQDIKAHMNPLKSGLEIRNRLLRIAAEK